MFKFIDIEQNTDEWLDLRAGKITSSKMGCIMANFGKSFGDPAKKYAINIAIERATGKAIPSSYSNEHMERGHEQEPVARMLYERKNFCLVSNGGFFEGVGIGCSPDGLVGNDGVIEIKSVIGTTHFANIKRNGIDPAYKWQCIANLSYTGREWLDFISYCEVYPATTQLFVHRIYAKDCQTEFQMIDERVNDFENLVSSCYEKIK